MPVSQSLWNMIEGKMEITEEFEQKVTETPVERTAEDVFSTQIKALQIVAMWPNFKQNSNMELFTRALLKINTFVLAYCTLALFVKGLLTQDLVDRSEAMDIFTLTTSALYKMIFFYTHHKEMDDMVNWGAALAHQVPPKWMQYTTFFSCFHNFMGIFSITFWGLCPIFKWIFGETDLDGMTLPINVYDPIGVTGAMYSVFYIVCDYGLLSAVQIYMASDAYLFTAIHLAIGGFETLNNKLRKMGQINFNKGPTVNDSMNEYLKDCVKLHTHILIYIRKIDRLFRSMIMADVLHAIISLSFAMLQASESKGIFENMKMAMFVSYCIVHQYLNSYFGQNLIDQQEILNKELLISVPWNDGSKEMKKSYQIMMAGCPKSVRLSAWSVYTLQYATFLEFVKSMISYFMVLRQVQDQTVKQP
ncbi:hypothetical protein GE061_010915 [Apolygus lucorum]|uniref:Odorant receptor n=1 Tax=Apolygus lucorum TaxID=248454 RepID=A0A6A4K0M2_APOLU|nr:hypothetical protein GE061_010915 [Apolygus lucorum]